MKCLNCDRPIYSRQHPKCGYCGAKIPPEWRFSEDVIEAIKAEQAAIEERRAKAKAKEEEEKKRNQGNNSGAGYGGF
jgi:HD-like signal output (HDOD) protein